MIKLQDLLKISIEEILSHKNLLLADTFHLNKFVDEKPPSLTQRILYRLQAYTNKLTWENLLPYVIFLGTVFYFIAYFTSYWNKVQWSVSFISINLRYKKNIQRVMSNSFLVVFGIHSLKLRVKHY